MNSIIICQKDSRRYDQASQTAKVYAREASDKRIADRIKIIEDSGTKIVKLDTKTQKRCVSRHSQFMMRSRRIS